MRQKYLFFILLFGLLSSNIYSQFDSWEKIYLTSGSDDYLTMVINKNALYICGRLGVKKSVNANSDWVSLPNIPKDLIFRNICVTSQGGIFVIPSYQKFILRTTNEGANWDTLLFDSRFYNMSTDNSGNIWMVREDGVLLNSTDNGYTWQYINRFSGSYIYLLSFNKNDDMFVSCSSGILYKTKNDTAWIKISDSYANSFASKGNDTLIFSNENGGTYLSKNKGIKWNYLPGAQIFNSIVFDSAGNIWGGVNANSLYNYTGVFKSTDFGETWKYFGGELGANKMIYSGNLFCIADRFGVCRYNKNITPYLGSNYFPLNINNKWMNYYFPHDYSKYSEARVDTLLITKDSLIRGRKYFFVEGMCGFTKHAYWYRFDDSSKILYALYNDTDRVMLNYNLLNNERFQRFDLKTGKYYETKCIRGTKTIFDSTRIYIGFNDYYSNGFSGRDYYELYYERIGYGYVDFYEDSHGAPGSTSAIRIICAIINDGDSIKTYRKPYAPEVSIAQMKVNKHFLFTLNIKADHYYSYYNPSNLPGSINFIDSVYLTGYYKKDDSITFARRYELSYKDSAINYTLSLQLDSTLINRGFDFYYKVTAKDKCFIPYYTSLPDIGYTKLLIDTTTTGVTNKDDKNIPESFCLLQNYPNPFNPLTTIQYSLPKESLVRLAVYNSLGQKVKELVNAVKPAGIYKVIFNAGNLSSGVFFYQLRANDFLQTKKLIIQK